VNGLARTAETRDLVADWFFDNYDKLIARFSGIFLISLVPNTLGAQCSVEQADRIERTLGPTIQKAGVAVLELQRTIETVRDCAALKQSKGGELARALAAK
jgi:hypothetical protein